MGFVIPHTSVMNLMETKSNCEYQVTCIMNTIQGLAMQSAAVTQLQTGASQAYLAQNTDEEGCPTEAAIAYANSDAFNAKYNSMLKSIQVKEQNLNLLKQQLTTKITSLTASIESFQKLRENNTQKLFKYGN